MTDILEQARDHYAATGIIDRLRRALAVFGPEDQRLTVQQLSGLDHFHTRGLAATVELAELAGLASGMSVLDIGAGVGGPARFLAATYGCRVTGVDLSDAFVDAARYLTDRTGQAGQVTFQAGSALDLPVGDGTFDAVLLQHVAMNIADREGLYREARRALKPQGRLAIFDVVAKSGEPHFPLPWSRTPQGSFLLSAEETRRAVEKAGFQAVVCRDDTETAKAWIGQLAGAGGPPAPNLGAVMGPDFPQLAANLGRSLMEGRLGVLTAIFEAV